MAYRRYVSRRRRPVRRSSGYYRKTVTIRRTRRPRRVVRRKRIVRRRRLVRERWIPAEEEAVLMADEYDRAAGTGVRHSMAGGAGQNRVVQSNDVAQDSPFLPPMPPLNADGAVASNSVHKRTRAMQLQEAVNTVNLKRKAGLVFGDIGSS